MHVYLILLVTTIPSYFDANDISIGSG